MYKIRHACDQHMANSVSFSSHDQIKLLTTSFFFSRPLNLLQFVTCSTSSELNIANDIPFPHHNLYSYWSFLSTSSSPQISTTHLVLDLFNLFLLYYSRSVYEINWLFGLLLLHISKKFSNFFSDQASVFPRSEEEEWLWGFFRYVWFSWRFNFRYQGLWSPLQSSNLRILKHSP